MYRLTNFGVIRLSDNANIVADPTNTNSDWVEYQTWLAAGNTPESGVDIEAIRNQKIEEINQMCGEELISGFTSDGIGSNHIYDSDIEDQLNMIGAVLFNEDTYYRCWPANSSDKQWVFHTAAQLRAVFDDGKVWKASLLVKASTLKAQVMAAQTIEDIQGIQW